MKGNKDFKILQKEPIKLEPDRWKEAYKLPLSVDDWGLFAFDAEHNMALSSFDDEDEAKEIVEIINGTKESTYEPKWEVVEGCKIIYDGEYMFLVRGWGHLTGCGAMGLRPVVAAAIQDQFIEYILGKLNGK